MLLLLPAAHRQPLIINITLAVSPPVTPTATSSATKSISSTNTLITNSSCNPIATVAPSGASPVSGSVTAAVTVQSNVQTTSNGSPYVPRYYDITPAANAAAVTATLTLYFTQAEFAAYNAYPGHGLNLPADAADAANYKANIRVYIFHSGTPVRTEQIDPDDNNIIWNSNYSRWEVTFSVVGFSEFFLASAGNTILPLQLTTFTGYSNGSITFLNWKVADETGVVRYEIERSKDGIQFATSGQVSAGNYSYTDQPSEKTVYYYRLKVINQEGKYTYSSIIAINLKKATTTVQVLPNPFKEKLLLNISTIGANSTEIRLMDMSGKVLVRRTTTLQTGTNAITLDGLEALTKGTYLLQVKNERLNETLKVVKAD